MLLRRPEIIQIYLKLCLFNHEVADVVKQLLSRDKGSLDLLGPSIVLLVELLAYGNPQFGSLYLHTTESAQDLDL